MYSFSQVGLAASLFKLDCRFHGLPKKQTKAYGIQWRRAPIGNRAL